MAYLNATSFTNYKEIDFSRQHVPLSILVGKLTIPETAAARELDAVWPGYGFSRHKGYGTPEHRQALQTLGTSAIHRLSYAPVAALQRVDERLRQDLLEGLEACTSVVALQAWVETDLRPAYGLLKLGWVEELRRTYGGRLARFALEDRA